MISPPRSRLAALALCVILASCTAPAPPNTAETTTPPPDTTAAALPAATSDDTETSPAPLQDTAQTAPTPSPSNQTPPQTAQDSLAAVLEDITATQRLILARLDSLGSEIGPSATQGDTATTPVIALEEATDEVRNLGSKIFWGIVVLAIFHLLIRLVIWLLETLAERNVARRLSIKWMIPIARVTLWGIATYLIVLNVFRVDAQGLLAASAALGVAVGIAAQDMLKNILGGLIVVFDQPFQVGDKIAVGGSYGEVVSIGLRSTRIVTADDNLVSIPNSQVVGEQVANANAGQLNCQVLAKLHLPGDVDESKAKAIAFEAAVNSPYVFLEKPIEVFVRDEFRATFATRIEIRAYVLDPRFELPFQSDMTERAREGFRAAGLGAPPDRRRLAHRAWDESLEAADE